MATFEDLDKQITKLKNDDFIRRMFPEGTVLIFKEIKGSDELTKRN